MKQSLIIIFLSISLAVTAQRAPKGMPTLGNPVVTDMQGQPVNTNAIQLNNTIQFKLPVFNMDMVNELAAGSTIKIDLGNTLQLKEGFDLAKAPLSDHFTWKQDKGADGQVSITGTLVKSLPANFVGKAVFELQSYKQGVSEVSMQWIKPVTNDVSERKDPQVYKLFITTK
jgi:hypothetical protein